MLPPPDKTEFLIASLVEKVNYLEKELAEVKTYTTPRIVTLKFSTVDSHITSIEIFGPNNNSTVVGAPKTSMSLTCYAGYRIIFKHNSSSTWQYYDASGTLHSIGNGSYCYFEVPAFPSSSESYLCLDTAGTRDELCLNESLGWVTTVTPVLGS